MLRKTPDVRFSTDFRDRSRHQARNCSAHGSNGRGTSTSSYALGTASSVNWKPLFSLMRVPLAHKDNELAPPHSINSSASDRNDAGTVNPSALAVVRLMTNSNLVSRSIGRSAGLAPLKNSTDIEPCMTIGFRHTVAVAHQAASSDGIALRINA